MTAQPQHRLRPLFLKDCFLLEVNAVNLSKISICFRLKQPSLYNLFSQSYDAIHDGSVTFNPKSMPNFGTSHSNFWNNLVFVTSHCEHSLDLVECFVLFKMSSWMLFPFTFITTLWGVWVRYYGPHFAATKVGAWCDSGSATTRGRAGTTRQVSGQWGAYPITRCCCSWKLGQHFLRLAHENNNNKCLLLGSVTFLSES